MRTITETYYAVNDEQFDAFATMCDTLAEMRQLTTDPVELEKLEDLREKIGDLWCHILRDDGTLN